MTAKVGTRPQEDHCTHYPAVDCCWIRRECANYNLPMWKVGLRKPFLISVHWRNPAVSPIVAMYRNLAVPYSPRWNQGISIIAGWKTTVRLCVSNRLIVPRWQKSGPEIRHWESSTALCNPSRAGARWTRRFRLLLEPGSAVSQLLIIGRSQVQILPGVLIPMNSGVISALTSQCSSHDS
jgi:hypothetical protein